MAAGRQNLSTHRSSIHSKEETSQYKNHYNQITSRHLFDHRRNGYVDVNHDRECRPVHLFDRDSQAKSKKEVYEDCSAKKRKYSPIVWDRAQKQIKISKDATHSLSDCDELQVSSVEYLVSDVSDVSDGVVLSEQQDGDYVVEPNLSKSKWAFQESPRTATDVNYSSPESGEFKQEGSERSEDVSSLSVETGHSENVDDSDNDTYEAPKRCGLDMNPSCRNVFEYERLNKISEGTYGVVYKARDKKNGEIVALKKVKMGNNREGFPVTALREVNVLGSLQHPSIVEVKEVVTDDFDGVYMVMEYVEHELKGYMDSMKHAFSQSEVKCLMLQLLEGLSYLHDNWVIHRDLKTSNILLNKNGDLKICDFGMSRQYGDPVKPYTPLVVTLWYRAPELLLGAKQYSTAIDMWSVGCIMAELLAKKPLFDGNREVEQIDKIFRTLGTPNESIWPGYSKLPGVKSSFVKQPLNNLRKRFPVATFTGSAVLTELGFDLLNKLLRYDPKKRITAEEALGHGWFREEPLPAQNVRICR